MHSLAGSRVAPATRAHAHATRGCSNLLAHHGCPAPRRLRADYGCFWFCVTRCVRLLDWQGALSQSIERGALRGEMARVVWARRHGVCVLCSVLAEMMERIELLVIVLSAVKVWCDLVLCDAPMGGSLWF